MGICFPLNYESLDGMPVSKPGLLVVRDICVLENNRIIAS
jgi:hypothetical protein